MKLNIVFLGCTQCYGHAFSAANTKVEFMAKGMVPLGDVITIHNGVIGNDGFSETTYEKVDGVGKVITYPKKGNQLISWLFNVSKLIKDLKTLHRKDCRNVVILEAPDFHILLLYAFLAHKLDYKIAVISHEWGPTVKTTRLLRRPSVWLFSKFFGYFADGIFPISEYIIEKISHFNKPYLKVPVLADYSKDIVNDVEKGHYFLYCVYAAYTRVIYKMIDAFSSYRNGGGEYGLKLVLSGSKDQIGKVESYIQGKSMNASIQTYSKVPYQQLLNLYAHASGLIIPLDPDSEQDWARFSQKIAEYVSSGSPIISNNVGEVKHYFKDKENCILCDYSMEGFCNAFKWISENSDKAVKIGQNGYELGKKEFNYITYGKKIHKFLESL